MRKILLAIDAQNPDLSTIDFACNIALLTTSVLDGVFLENLLFEEINELARASVYDNDISSHDEKNKITENNIRLFREVCKKRGVQTNIHRKRGLPADGMIEESRFADLIIVDPEMSFKKKFEPTPTDFAKDILEEAECPVIISPETFTGIDEIIFTYNGSRSSVLAIKQFSYLFPELHNKKITLLEVNKGEKHSVTDKPRIATWLNTHYNDINFKVIEGDSGEELFKYLVGTKNVFVVMGAYGRGTLSSLFKSSRASLIIRATDFPVFITHY